MEVRVQKGDTQGERSKKRVLEGDWACAAGVETSLTSSVSISWLVSVAMESCLGFANHMVSDCRTVPPPLSLEWDSRDMLRVTVHRWSGVVLRAMNILEYK